MAPPASAKAMDPMAETYSLATPAATVVPLRTFEKTEQKGADDPIRHYPGSR